MDVDSLARYVAEHLFEQELENSLLTLTKFEVEVLYCSQASIMM